MTDWRELDDSNPDELVADSSEFQGLLARVVEKHKARRFYEPPKRHDSQQASEDGDGASFLTAQKALEQSHIRPEDMLSESAAAPRRKTHAPALGEDAVDQLHRLQSQGNLDLEAEKVNSSALMSFFRVFNRDKTSGRASQESSTTRVGLGVLSITIVLLTGGVFAVPYFIWTRADISDSQRVLIEEQRAATLPSDGPKDAPFKLPVASGNNSPPATGVLDNGGPKRRGADATDTADRSDSVEFRLADSRSTLGKLEELIYSYIARGKFRRARDLAVAAMRSRVATKEERMHFFDLYKQCQRSILT
ncbi:MAG TPA: hypothetical protein V6D22_10825 [Candidatus Obscuribacterales bacterium]